MLKKRQIKKVLVIAITMMVSTIAFASFTLTGTVDEKGKSSKYSLKNITHYSNKSFSLSLLRTTIQNKGTTLIIPKNNTNSSFLQIERGNTTYVLPYKYKVKTPKFKTPSANN
ncbi:MAG: hypothetical protein ACOVO1_13350 [Chitinophagaceae bacterium]